MDTVLLLPVLIAVFFICVFIHEIGHIVAGKMVGINVRNMFVGPFYFSFGADQPLIRLNKNNLLYAFGVCINPEVTKGYRNLNNRYSVLLAGGPTLSFLFALPAIMFSLNNGNEFLGFLGKMSLAIAAATCFSDLKKAWDLKKNPKNEHDLIKSLICSKLIDNELLSYMCRYIKNISDWDNLTTEKVKILGLWTRCTLAGYLEGPDLEFEAVISALFTDKALIEDKSSQLYVLETIYTAILYEATEKGNIEIAAKWFEQVQKYKVPAILEYDAFLVRMYFSKGKREDCIEMLERIHKKYQMIGYEQMERRVIERLFGANKQIA